MDRRDSRQKEYTHGLQPAADLTGASPVRPDPGSRHREVSVDDLPIPPLFDRDLRVADVGPLEEWGHGVWRDLVEVPGEVIAHEQSHVSPNDDADRAGVMRVHDANPCAVMGPHP
jgi:hypothetical protein